ncbi:hypothetical protein DFH06DRAFT_1187962 [Mycena polygramma]|nr:hypothetical protein DFH06DRAFT_1187962 [Mycena polygramma]
MGRTINLLTHFTSLNSSRSSEGPVSAPMRTILCPRRGPCWPMQFNVFLICAGSLAFGTEASGLSAICTDQFAARAARSLSSSAPNSDVVPVGWSLGETRHRKAPHSTEPCANGIFCSQSKPALILLSIFQTLRLDGIELRPKFDKYRRR